MYTGTFSWVSKLVCIYNILKISLCLFPCAREHFHVSCLYHHPVSNFAPKLFPVTSFLCSWSSTVRIHIVPKILNRRNHFGTKSCSRIDPGALGGPRHFCICGKSTPPESKVDLRVRASGFIGKVAIVLCSRATESK